MTENELYHFGILGMRWGVRKESAKSSRIRFKYIPMSDESKSEANRLWDLVDEIEFHKGERNRVIEAFDNDLSDEEKASPIVSQALSNGYEYTAVNRGHNEYKVFDRTPIENTDGFTKIPKKSVKKPWYSDIMDEVLDFNWRDIDE